MKVTAIVLAACLICGGAAAWVDVGPSMELRVSNPYRMDVVVEIKCQWNERLKDFDYHRFVKFDGGSVTGITVPSHYKQCELWPKVIFWGGR